jgi:hypothetical protein
MPSKPLKPKGESIVLAATLPRPGDFPLGSPESRAVARILLDRTRRTKASTALDAAVQALEDQRIYEPKYTRDRHGIVDPAADAIDEYFSSTGETGAPGRPAPPTVMRKWLPKTRAQWAALQSEADILLFGGAAGSLKSATMLMDAAQEFRNPNFMAVIFRESYPNLQDLIKKAWRLYPNYPYFGEYNKTRKGLALSHQRCRAG